jgi:flagellar assembly protein FliH
MTSSWPESLIVVDDDRVRPARLDKRLRGSSLLETLRADARIVDPHLERLVEDTVALAETMGREQGAAQGYADGVAQGLAAAAAEAVVQRAADEDALAEALERLRSLGSALTRAAESLEHRAAPTYDQVGAELGPSVVDLVEVLLGRELRDDTTPFVDAVRRAVARSGRGADLLLHLNPDDLDSARALGIDLEQVAGRPVHVVGDPTVERGGAVADSGARRVDACVSTAVATLRAELAL